jgi:hypothetical protein
MSDLFHIIFIFILFLIPLIYTLDFNSQNIFVYGIEEHQLGESTSKNFFTVMVGFHPQKYDPTIVTKAGGIIIYEYKPTIDALSANITEEIYTTLLNHPSIKYIKRF